MSGNPFFSGRISNELFDHIEKFRENSGESKTELLIRALSAYTGFSLPKTEIELDNPLLNRMAELEKLVKQNQHLITKHEDIINKLQHNSEKEAKVPIKLQKEENEEILPLFNSDNKNDNRDDNQWEILSTKEATKKCGIKSNATIPTWKRKGELPKKINNYLIDYSHTKKENGVTKMFFKIKTIIDNI